MMDNMINGRTPEEIKLGLVHCLTAREYRNCLVCPYGTPRKRGMLPCDCEVRQDILALIDQLENHIGELTEMVQQLERERDAAVEILRDFKMCAGCDHKGCADCRWFDDVTMKNKDLHDNWQWRGVQEVE